MILRVGIESGLNGNNELNDLQSEHPDHSIEQANFNQLPKVDKKESTLNQIEGGDQNKELDEEDFDQEVPTELDKEAIFEMIFGELNFNENKKYIDYEEFSKVLWSSNIDSLCVINLELSE